MSVLQQIASDAQYLRNLISGLTSDRCTVEADGVWLSGASLEAVLKNTREATRVELKALELILESGVIPDTYYSTITKQSYVPSADELIKKAEGLPKASHTFFTSKKSRKSDCNQKNSRFTLIADDASPVFTFFMEKKGDKKYPKGNFAAKVKQGFLADGGDAPKYAVKIYKKGIFSGNSIHELRVAMHAAYCYRMLGRAGLAFRTNQKQYVVTEWLTGVDLGLANQEQIQSMPIPRRIVMAISLLRELNILHKAGLIHNDIKPGNVMVNFGKLSFVDLDSVRCKNEAPYYGTTPMFTERFLPSAQISFDIKHNSGELHLKFDEQTDIFAMGLTLIHLFQEIYVPKELDQEINVAGGPIKTHIFHTFALGHGTQYASHPALQQLLKKMIMYTPHAPMTVEQLLSEFKAVLLTYPGYEDYLAEDRLVDLKADYTPEVGAQSFKEIEIELLGFNQRAEAVNRKLSM